MPTAHYIPLSALADNGLYPSNSNRTIDTAPKLDVNIPRSNPQLASNIISNNPRTMNVTTNGLSLPAIRSNSDSTVNNDQHDMKNYTSFNEHIKNLKAYKEKNGHVNVSRKTDERLYQWCAHVRHVRRNPETCETILREERIAELDAVGFEWGTARIRENKISFQDRVESLRRYKEKHGHLSVKERDDKSLFKWCSIITGARRGKHGIKLTADRITELDAIGFDWTIARIIEKTSKQMSFQDRVKALGEYKEKHGHLSVKERDDNSLFKWCVNIKSARNKPGEGKLKLTTDRVAALDAIGYDWRLSKSFLQPFDSLGYDADKAGKSEENTVKNCQYKEDGFQHDDLEHVGVPNTLVTFREINHDGLTEEENTLFDMIESSVY